MSLTLILTLTTDVLEYKFILMVFHEGMFQLDTSTQ